jgi:hypothetical protein
MTLYTGFWRFFGPPSLQDVETRVKASKRKKRKPFYWPSQPIIMDKVVEEEAVKLGIQLPVATAVLEPPEIQPQETRQLLPAMARSCANCLYQCSTLSEVPCNTCLAQSNWELEPEAWSK